MTFVKKIKRGNDGLKNTDDRVAVDATINFKAEDDPFAVSHVSISRNFTPRNSYSPNCSEKSSGDFTPSSERSASNKTLGNEVERLKKLAGNIRMTNKVKANDTSESTENRAASNATINFEKENDPSVFNVSNSKNSSQHNSEGAESLFNNSTPFAFQRTKSSDVSVPTENNGRTNAVNPKLLIDDGKIMEMDVQQEKVDIDLNRRLESIEKRLKTIEEQNNKLIKQTEEILDESSNENSGEVGLAEGSLYEPLKDFPLSRVAEFNELNNVNNKERRKKLYYHLLRLGGTKLRNFLHCALKETMRDELVCQFIWGEKKGTEKFGNTRVSNILYHTAKDCPLFQGPENKAQFKAEMQEVIRTTKQRHRNQKKIKLLPNEPRDEEDEDDLRRRITVLEKTIADQSSDDSYADNEAEQSSDDADS